MHEGPKMASFGGWIGIRRRRFCAGAEKVIDIIGVCAPLPLQNCCGKTVFFDKAVKKNL